MWSATVGVFEVVWGTVLRASNPLLFVVAARLSDVNVHLSFGAAAADEFLARLVGCNDPLCQVAGNKKQVLSSPDLFFSAANDRVFEGEGITNSLLMNEDAERVVTVRQCNVSANADSARNLEAAVGHDVGDVSIGVSATRQTV